jgi:uncharacterized protein (DUF342 family)
MRQQLADAQQTAREHVRALEEEVQQLQRQLQQLQRQLADAAQLEEEETLSSGLKKQSMLQDAVSQRVLPLEAEIGQLKQQLQRSERELEEVCVCVCVCVPAFCFCVCLGVCVCVGV